jgi:D-glycero-D-manno-heptose 1,7-bisphosphate phosphatase
MENIPIGAKIEPGQLWCQVINRPQSPHKGALFLDRDGVIVEDTGYLHRPEDVNLINGAAEILSEANRLRVPVIIVTNQAGIARGKFSWKEFIEVQEKIVQILDYQGAFLNAVFACPHHVDGYPPFSTPNHPWRKPNPGMLIEASQRLSINLSKSWLIGDRASDLQAANSAGLMGGTHVLTGHGSDDGERKKAMNLNCDEFKCLTADSIADTGGIFQDLKAN